MLTNERNPTTKPVKFESEAYMREARSRVSFEQLLQQYGAGPNGGGKWGGIECPICKAKTKRGGTTRIYDDSVPRVCLGSVWGVVGGAL